MQVYSFLHETQQLLALKDIPSLSALEAALFSSSLSTTKAHTVHSTEPSTSAAPYVAAVVPLLQLLASDIYSAVAEQHIEKGGVISHQEKDMAAGEPVVQEQNWQHVCSGMFAGMHHVAADKRI